MSTGSFLEIEYTHCGFVKLACPHFKKTSLAQEQKSEIFVSSHRQIFPVFFIISVKMDKLRKRNDRRKETLGSLNILARD